MTSFQFATRITNAILSGQSHVNFCYRIMCRFNLFAIIRMRFKPLARRNFYVKNFLLLANERNEDFFCAKCQIELNFAFRPVSKRFWPKNCFETYIDRMVQLGKMVSNYRWQFFEQGFFMHVILAFSKHCIAQNTFWNISKVRPLVRLSLK